MKFALMRSLLLGVVLGAVGCDSSPPPKIPESTPPAPEKDPGPPTAAPSPNQAK